LPIHLTHIQFHSYGKEGKRGFSSGAAAIADAVNRLKNVSIDVGQVMFGRTITASGDTMAQYRNRTHADPAKWIIMDIECDGGCGLVPFNYRDRNFVNALQWAIGLELFLMVEDPSRIFLTTDHPNGAPFDVYPELIRLLMDEPFRKEALGRIHKGAAAASALGTLTRVYSMAEIATMTRSAPAAVLGLGGRGTLAPGAAADIAVYDDDPDRQRMFGRPHLVFKDGVLVAREGTVVAPVQGRTYVARPRFDPAIEKPLGDFFARHSTIALENFRLGEEDAPRSVLVAEPGPRPAA
jgi:formylmethanofuran dehydrogenase subunit A